ncbi:MAG: ABC transporter ATP-binding protein [Clostridiales bacterium]|nr:ABC transporter ATP-binding protein [Clostridiales bacterium]MDY2835316.1 ABC transporter ATP-binding protein [Candidatus Aphodomonas sp.]
MTTSDFRQKSPFRIFFSYFRPHWKLFTLDMICAFIVAGINLIYPILSRRALTELLPKNAYQAFFAVVVVMVAMYVIRAALQYIITFWGHTFGVLVEADIRRDLFSHFEALSFDFYDRNRTGHLMSRLTTDLFDVTELAHHGPEDVFISGVTIIGALIVMFRIQWRLALVVAVILPIAVVVVFCLRRRMMRTSRQVKARQANINAAIESSLSGIRVAKAFANEEGEIEKFGEANESYKTVKHEYYKVMATFFSSIEFFLSVLSVAVIGAGGLLIMKGRLNYVDLITFQLYVSAFTTPLRKIANFSETFTNGTAGFMRFLEIMRTEPTLQDAPGAVELKKAKGEIELKDVHFAYKEDQEVLDGVSLTVHPGEKIGVVGSSGSGKSTLCQLVPRFYDVDSGSICLDGTDVRRITQHSLRSQIGIVQQDVFLFAASIRDNIRYGRPDATDEEVEQAARRAEIYDDIMAMPAGFDTWVGERGTLLSGGQKQRVAIARIFLKNPPVLILDEATSALDSVTEARIQRSFDELAKGRTSLIIAHRLSTIRNADRIVVVEEGKILEEGTHDELLAKGGEYARLYRVQNALDANE